MHAKFIIVVPACPWDTTSSFKIQYRGAEMACEQRLHTHREYGVEEEKHYHCYITETWGAPFLPVITLFLCSFSDERAAQGDIISREVPWLHGISTTLHTLSTRSLWEGMNGVKFPWAQWKSPCEIGSPVAWDTLWLWITLCPTICWKTEMEPFPNISDRQS